MSTCPRCHAPVIRCHLSAATTVLLQPGPHVYVPVGFEADRPEEDARVCEGLGMVEHAAVCAAREEPTS